MHLIQFLLQIFHLLFDGLLPVNLLVIRFLRVLGLSRDFGHLQMLIDHLLHFLHTGLAAVFLQNRVFFFRGIRQPLGHHRCHFSHRLHGQDIRPGHRAPLESCRKLHQRLLQVIQMLSVLLFGQIIDIRFSGNCKLNIQTRGNNDFFYIDTVRSIDDDKSLLIDL